MSTTITDRQETIVVLPSWVTRYAASFTAGEAHAFVLHGDLNGYASFGVTHRALLEQQIVGRNRMLVRYNRVDGITFAFDSHRQEAAQVLGLVAQSPAADPMQAALAAAVGGPAATDDDDPFARFQRPGEALAVLAELLRHPLLRGRAPDEAPPEGITVNGVAVVIDHADVLCPPADKGTMSPDDRTLLLALLRLATDERIGANNNPVFLLTPRLDALHPDLRAADGGWKAVEIALPDLTQRQDYLDAYLADRTANDAPIALADDLTTAEIATLTAGLNLRHLEDVLLHGAQQGGVDRWLVRGRKDEIIAATYTDVAEMIEPLSNGFGDIGGMEPLKAWARDEVIAPLRSASRDVPKGVLLVGPPGTGKTYFVRALARETGFNAVALRAENILGGIVGESEAKLRRFLGFARSLSPVLIFVDEIDQSDMAQRGNSSGNPVAANLFNQLLQFMSDETLRGKVIVLFASNRPDLLDPALLRFGRMDAVIPVLLPEPTERAAIVQAQARAQGMPVTDDALDVLVTNTDKYSAADLGALVGKARKVARRAANDTIDADAALAALRLIRPSGVQTADYYTLLAVQACNDAEFLPERYAALLQDRQQLTQQVEREQQTVGAGRQARTW